jgi:phage repressor protein C with HTH and peptisase S24 domain
MANFLVHGDLVLFDTRNNSKRLLPNHIYAFSMPTGLIIRRVLVRPDGRVLLTADNHDKQRFPDIEYSAEDATHLHIIGRFFLLKR